jgi:predicted RNA-binding Zn-ribbon protein involved in translation (DUF1610 family)
MAAKQSVCKNCGCYYDNEPIIEVDTWNVGHYGCTMANAPRRIIGYEEITLCPHCGHDSAKNERVENQHKRDDYRKNYYDKLILTATLEGRVIKDIRNQCYFTPEEFEQLAQYEDTSSYKLETLDEMKLWIQARHIHFNNKLAELKKYESFMRRNDCLENQTDKKIVMHVCPECGTKMIVRNGKFGDFLGCLAYPNCKGTRNLDGTTRASVPFNTNFRR